MELEEIRKIKKQYEREWLQLPEVVAVGIGILSDKRTGIIVSATTVNEALRLKIPGQIAGVTIELNETGRLEAFR